MTMMGMLFLVPQFFGPMQHPHYRTWSHLAVAGVASDIIKAAATSRALKERVVTEGLVDVTMATICERVGVKDFHDDLWHVPFHTLASKFTELPVGPVDETTAPTGL